MVASCGLENLRILRSGLKGASRQHPPFWEGRPLRAREGCVAVEANRQHPPFGRVGLSGPGMVFIAVEASRQHPPFWESDASVNRCKFHTQKAGRSPCLWA
jgi:hypothetical protein